ncbi:Aldo/keto reductase [Pilatotrama ljubarskyi]|nr:Aldo/keto reductase [Pilatotrama ljubarskyi]
MPLPTRKVGDSDVSAIGYGAMGISAFYGKPLPDEERFKVLDAVYENGCTFWDTADRYADSEELIGKWFKRTGKRDEIFLATLWIRYTLKSTVSHMATKFGQVPDPDRAINGTPEYAVQALDASLKRLGTDHVDLADPLVPIELSVGAMAEQVKLGKVKYIGLSEATLRRAHAVHPISALQVEYSPFTLDIEDPDVGLLKAARELGIKIIAYSPLGRGLLTGRYKGPEDFDEDDFRRKVPRYSKENFPNILKIADGLKKIGEKYNATAGQVALAWLLAQGDDVIPIPGTTKIPNLQENLDSVNIKLSPEDVQEVREIAVRADAANGPRYPARLQAVLYADTPPLQE